MRDGENHSFTIESLNKDHAAALRRLFWSLDRVGRCRRFGAAVSDAGIAAYAEHALATAHWTAGAFVGGELRGVVELHASENPALAEAAFVVEAGWRRRGLAGALLTCARTFALDASYEAIRMIFSRHDWPMRALASKVGAKLDLLFDEIVAEVAVAETARQSQYRMSA
jgi:GNAT superfamily N-acetyltransferase